MGKLVELEQISKIYTNQYVLRNISLTIDENQIIAILGGNGTGKSTLLRMISGIERPSSGNVVYSRKNIKIGYVPERFPKQLRFTPSEYLNYIGKISGISGANLKKMIPDFLRRFQLEKLNNHWIRDLSKGNIQKVGIIQSVMQQPDLFILDEPASGLDFHAQQELLMIIKKLKEHGTTILLTYHGSTIFEDVVDSTYILKNGHISKTNTKKREKESLKLLRVKRIDDSYVKQWDEILHMEKEGDDLLLYVHLENSDQVLSKVLKLQGSIERVTTIGFNEKFHKEGGK